MTNKTNAVDALRIRLGDCEAKTTELIAERSEIAYLAHVDRDAKAIKRLAEINAEIDCIKTEAASIEPALKEATRREMAAIEAAAADKRCDDARAADALLDEAELLAQRYDDALQTARQTAIEFESAMVRVRRLTGTSPKHDAVRVFLFRAVRSAFFQTPINIDAIAPSERTALMPVFLSWAKNARVHIANTINKAREAA